MMWSTFGPPKLELVAEWNSKPKHGVLCPKVNNIRTQGFNLQR